MIKSKKYNTLKHKKLNGLFDFYSNDSSNDLLHNSKYKSLLKEKNIKNIIIKITDDYQIIKEEFLDTYILSFKNIIVIHLKEEFIKDFEFLYNKSDEYVFDIYYTIIPDLKINNKMVKTYHIFCTSKKIEDLYSYIEFINANDGDSKYVCLSLFYNSCIIINKRFDIINPYYKLNSKYIYVKTIGKGLSNIILKNTLKSIINMVNIYQQTLPPHYLKIHS
jgi:hypothetical protein